MSLVSFKGNDQIDQWLVAEVEQNGKGLLCHNSGAHPFLGWFHFQKNMGLTQRISQVVLSLVTEAACRGALTCPIKIPESVILSEVKYEVGNQLHSSLKVISSVFAAKLNIKLEFKKVEGCGKHCPWVNHREFRAVWNSDVRLVDFRKPPKLPTALPLIDRMMQDRENGGGDLTLVFGMEYSFNVHLTIAAAFSDMIKAACRSGMQEQSKVINLPQVTALSKAELEAVIHMMYKDKIDLSKLPHRSIIHLQRLGAFLQSRVLQTETFNYISEFINTFSLYDLLLLLFHNTEISFAEMDALCRWIISKTPDFPSLLTGDIEAENIVMMFAVSNYYAWQSLQECLIAAWKDFSDENRTALLGTAIALRNEAAITALRRLSEGHFQTHS